MSAATDQRAPVTVSTGQADRDGEAVEVDVGVVQAEAVPAVLERAEDETGPALGVERAVEEGAAFEPLAAGRGGRDVLEHDRQRIVPGGGARWRRRMLSAFSDSVAWNVTAVPCGQGAPSSG